MRGDLSSAIASLVEHLDDCSTADEHLGLTARALHGLGVHAAYTDLSSSPFESGRCMETTRSSLSFMGHTGSKWREHPRFSAFLENLTRFRGRVNFLLSEDVSAATVEQLVELEQRYGCFHAKIYLSRPMFRLVIQDDQVIALQHYEGRDAIPIGDRDDAPLLTLTARGEESLFRALTVHFKTVWSQATPVGDL